MFSTRLLRAGLVGIALTGPRIVEGQGSTRSTDPIAVLVATYDSAWNSKDTVTVSRLLAPQYQYFTSLGGVQTRPEVLSFLGSPDYALERAARSEVRVTRSGPAAVVSSRWQGRGTYKGKPFTDDQRCGQVWLQTARRWQVLSEHCVQIAPEAP
jgi:ketosteroid isomerase-like protein